MAQAAYGRRGASLRTSRSTEYAVFARITRRVQIAERRGAAGFPDLASALHDNRRLWTILATDLAGEDNQLPDSLRAGLLSLAAFTFEHTAQVLAGHAKAAPLVEINAAVMRGLMDEGPGR